MWRVRRMASRGEAQRRCLSLLIVLCQVNADPDPAQACSQGSPTMDCRGLSFYSVPTHLPDGTRKLDLSYNFIQNLTIASMSRLQNLEDLDLHHNHLETIDPGALDSLTRLRSLNLASNRLHTCPASRRGVFDGTRSLGTLSLANNNLDGEAALCYLSNVPSLVRLDLSRNAIVLLFSGMFDGIPGLSELDLSNNFIDEIQSGALDSLKDLRVLNLAENAIRCISSFDLHQLHSLNLSSNIIEFFLTKEAGERHQLLSLDLSRNNLRHFPVLTGFQMVRHVNLSGNGIAHLVPLSDDEGWWRYEATTDLVPLSDVTEEDDEGRSRYEAITDLVPLSDDEGWWRYEATTDLDPLSDDEGWSRYEATTDLVPLSDTTEEDDEGRSRYEATTDLVPLSDATEEDDEGWSRYEATTDLVPLSDATEEDDEGWSRYEATTDLVPLSDTTEEDDEGRSRYEATTDLVPLSDATEEDDEGWSRYEATTDLVPLSDATGEEDEGRSRYEATTDLDPLSDATEEDDEGRSRYEATTDLVPLSDAAEEDDEGWSRYEATTDLVPLFDATEEDDEGWSRYEATTDLDLPTAIERSFSRLSNVRHLDLSSNQLAAIPWSYLSKMSELSHLLLSGNCLENLMATKETSETAETIKGLDGTLRSLKVIDLQANSIRFIPKRIFHFLPEIEHINLKSNEIGFCPSRAIGRKRSAINQRHCSTFSGASNLHYLNLQNNKIRHLPPRVFEGTPLVSLDLSHNPTLEIQDAALDDLSRSLQVLSLHGNGMEDSQMNLPCLQSLKSLEASNNRLTGLPSGMKCSSVESLDLRNNSLKTLKEVTASQWKDGLRSLSISGNPLDCCSLAWLDLLLTAKVDIRDLEEARCVYAKSEGGVPMNGTRHDYHCPRPTGDGHLKIAVIVLSGSFTLISVLCYVHKRRDPKLCRTRSSKVAPETLETPAPAKGFHAEGQQVCFTISRKEFDG